jgi:hypothetical protein
MIFKYATLNVDIQDVPAGTEVIVLHRHEDVIGRGKCLLHVEPHPTDPTCDWSWLYDVPECDLTYTGRVWDDVKQEYRIEAVEPSC